MKRIVFNDINKISIEESATPKLNKGYIRVIHYYSLVSAGTELLKLQGKMGSLPSLKVGYSAVGKIVDGVEGTEWNIGDFVFTRGPHVDVYDVSHEYASSNFVLIDRENAVEGTFLELGKVALHALHRACINLGDWVVVVGLGIVGNLVAQLASLATGGKVIGIDPIAERRKIIGKCGIIALNPLDSDFLRVLYGYIPDGPRILFEASGSEEALNMSFRISALRGQIILIAGHYGKRLLDIKTDFQNKELSLIAARRLEITKRSMEDWWTVLECKKEFYNLLSIGKINLKSLITNVVRPNDAPEIYLKLAEHDPAVFGVIFDWRT